MATAIVPVSGNFMDPAKEKEKEPAERRTSNASNSKPAVKLMSKRTLKLPGCTYHIAMRRVNNFTKIALLAAVATGGLSGVKFWLAREGERQAAREVLENTGETVAKALKLQMERDFATLDAVANLWHLDSQMTRPEFRKFVLSEYFKPNLESFQTVILIHRIERHQRDETETEASAVELRRACCSGTTYDMYNSICRERAKNQCKITGPDRYYFTEATTDENGKRKVGLASRNGTEDHLIVMYQEPLELNPGPIGLDMQSLPSRKEAFWASDRHGMKGVTRRMRRVFASKPEFGMLVWNNVFVDRQVDANKTILQGVNLMKKNRVLEKGGDPYSIGSAVAVYRPQVMFSNAIAKVFGRELSDTQLFLLDERQVAKSKNEHLLALFDPLMTTVQMNDEAMRLSDKSRSDLLDHDDVQINDFTVGDSDGHFSVAVVPTDNFMSAHTTEYPTIILVLSLSLVLVAQLERWIGHPFIISQSALMRAQMEAEIRAELEAEIVESAAAMAMDTPVQQKYSGN